MQALIRTVLLALACSWIGLAAAQDNAPPQAAPRFAPPASFAGSPEPQPNESNAQRAKTQPGNNAPFWRQVHDSGSTAGVTNLPGAEKGVLIQPFVQYPGSRYTNAGEAWRQVRNRWIVPYGGALIAIIAVALALFHWRKGPIGHAENHGGPIERFTYFERAAHWSNAIAFCVLAISGIVMAFGKFFLLPLMGHLLFGWLTYLLKTAHNFFGPLFAVSLVIVIVTFIRDELPQRGDLDWLKKGGGVMSGQEPPSHRFNAGEKIIFWAGVFVMGLVLVGSGLVLDKLVPGLAYWRSDMQVAHMVHSVAAVLMITMFLLHIYLGTIGMRGAYRAMRDGWVDEQWAREHHAYWHEDIEAGKIPAQRTDASPPGRHATQP
ncbi:MAG TPA: formate dehydrogenase subunit gamma [Albitalea sp.]|uniref:formate dehydrogenase subunit gamma n=1 Tax=Piscinibacter sp. TaxID=1903157 RepID=UPI002ED01A40